MTTKTGNPAESMDCFGCMHQECTASRRLMQEEPQGNLSITPGQATETAWPLTVLVREALVALLPLIVGFIGGFMGAGIIFPGSGDPSRAAGGVVTLVAAAFITYRVRSTPND
ncbi:MAG: hypothetical protein LBT14_11470 [Treponema sp.]|jgi:hypothetical protein|nr:hypothetical protein [Treponema sp.]